MDEGVVKVEFSQAEAIVLFEFLARTNKEERFPVVDQAELRVLWDIECMLEKTLVAPLRADWDELLDRARSEVRDDDSQPGDPSGR